ncbi:GGDEF domain-containing protein [Coralloluteibacterium thermophilus]|uniref:diguanylate cyclase n=1 Tax=Coralloluteibacterium thermophilum TaxID=2707049 RepID=A0ABV9NKQ4_9GAMM
MAEHSEHGDTTRLTVPGVAPRPPAPSRACLVVIAGEAIGTRVDVGEHPLRVGRGHDCDLVLAHPSVSRRHCEVWCAPDGCHVRDLGATNPVRINDRLLAHGPSAPLVDGDLVVVGNCILKFIGAGSVEARYHEEAYEVATRDTLTGLHNRRHFLDVLDRAIVAARRGRRPLSLAILDVDHFKRINDSLGHLAGDAVLRRLAALLRAQVRGDEAIGRIGGEEFAVLLPGADLAAGAEAGERLRAAVAAAEVRAAEGAGATTISVGVATLGTCTERSGLLRAADVALYAAKDAGRDCVRTSGPSPAGP